MDTETSPKRYRATGHLRTVLIDQGRKRSWLARKVKISESFVRYLLTGERTASEEVANNIATALGVPLFLIFECTSVPSIITDVQRDEAVA